MVYPGFTFQVYDFTFRTLLFEATKSDLGLNPSSRAEHRKKQADQPFKLFEAPALWGPSS
jgi:hypothetical protein